MMPRPINLRQIEVFKALIESGTVSAAADLIGLSQPAASKLIANLELDSGVRLFDRVKGRLAPTAHALRLYDEVGRIFAGVRQVQNAIEAIRREEQGQIAIGVLPALTGSFIQRATSRFLNVAPTVFCSVQGLSSLWIVELLIARKLDVGLVDGGSESPYLVQEPFMEAPLVCVMPNGHAFESKACIEPKDLDQESFVTMNSDSNFGHRIRNTLESYGVRPRIGIVSNGMRTICEFVAAGHGVSLVHPLMVLGVEDRVAVRRFEPEILYSYKLSRSADSRNSKVVDLFAQELHALALEVFEESALRTDPAPAK